MAAPRQNLWRQATSTTGGKIATAVAIALAALLGLGACTAAVVALTYDRGEDLIERVGNNGNGNGWGRGGNPDRGDDDTERRLPGPPRPNGNNGNGNGMGQLGPGLLGDVDHGEFTTTGSDGKPVTMTVQRGEVTSVSDTSLAVTSDDDFSATYVLNSDTRMSRGASALQKGDTVAVLARKADKVAVVVRAGRR
jgi:hypothetical protein